MAVKIALPKGRLLRKTAAILQKAEWGLDDYQSSVSFYRPRSSKFPDALIRIFNEKDIPIQIAMGNYDLGICGQDWIEELLVKYPSSDVVKIKDLLYGDGSLLLMAASPKQNLHSNGSPLRIASEYPNLAEAYALKNRLSRFAVFPVWGAAEAYPPENAELALLSTETLSEVNKLVLLNKVLDYSTFLIANRHSWENKNLEKIVTSIFEALPELTKAADKKETAQAGTAKRFTPPSIGKDTVRLALPDGHQQQQTVDLLNKAGIKISDYPSQNGNRRPVIDDMEGVTVKVIRPQDMPLQIANNNFDLAITGRDWLTDHLAQFPLSPAGEIIDLKLRKVRLVAVVHQDLPVDDIAGLSRLLSSREQPFRVASEYVNIADKYARENHLGNYQVIPTWGATEAFVPEDADMLVENTETGRTIARHNLKIIGTLFESTACLIGNNLEASEVKSRRIKNIVNKLRAATGA